LSTVTEAHCLPRRRAADAKIDALGLVSKRAHTKIDVRGPAAAADRLRD
jgi:hypothetical protein